MSPPAPLPPTFTEARTETHSRDDLQKSADPLPTAHLPSRSSSFPTMETNMEDPAGKKGFWERFFGLN
jgi:hypothetical protein